MTIGFTYYRDGKRLSNFLWRLRFKKQVLAITQKHGVEGFTLLNALGAWRGKTEPSFQMLIEGVDRQIVERVARDFRDCFAQESVMLKDGEKVDFLY